MNVTFYHWGIHGWIVYSITGAVLGLVTYRKGKCLIITFSFSFISIFDFVKFCFQTRPVHGQYMASTWLKICMVMLGV